RTDWRHGLHARADRQDQRERLLDLCGRGPCHWRTGRAAAEPGPGEGEDGEGAAGDRRRMISLWRRVRLARVAVGGNAWVPWAHCTAVVTAVTPPGMDRTTMCFFAGVFHVRKDSGSGGWQPHLAGRVAGGDCPG